MLAGPTFGFSSVAADRGVGVDISADSPYLGIEESYSGQTVTSTEQQPVIRLTNRFDQTLGGSDGTVTVEVRNVSGDIQNDSALVVDNSPTIAPGDSANIDVICADNSIKGKNTVDISLKIVEASGQAVSVSDKTVGPVTGVEIQCKETKQTQSGLTNVWASDLSANDENETQTLEFELTNKLAGGESVEIDLKDANKVDYTGASVSTSASGSVQFTGNKNRVIEFTASDGTVNAGTTIAVDVSRIDTTGNNVVGTYDATFTKDGEPDSETTPFDVN